jgi:predicted phosphoribosyltransferase
MLFQDRQEAARLLSEKLKQYKGQCPLILAIPRGAVPMGQVIAEALDGELDVILVHKLGAPGNPEFAIGSVSECGDIFLSSAAADMGISEGYIDREVKTQLENLRRRRALYTPVRPPIDPFNRIIIVVDNGIATGSTMIAALRAVKVKRPAKLIGAVAVAPPETLDRIAKEADEVVYLAAPPNFYAVGQFFLNFTQVSDDEVIEILKQAPQQARVPTSRHG